MGKTGRKRQECFSFFCFVLFLFFFVFVFVFFGGGVAVKGVTEKRESCIDRYITQKN